MTANRRPSGPSNDSPGNGSPGNGGPGNGGSGGGPGGGGPGGGGPSGGWAGRFEDELLRLGLQPGRARQLTEETAQQAAESATAPDPLFGPAHLYARHLLTELNTAPHPAIANPNPRPNPGPGRGPGPDPGRGSGLGGGNGPGSSGPGGSSGLNPGSGLGPIRGPGPGPGAVRLRLTGVSKRYRRRTVFSDVDLTVRAGEVTAIVGANGCGKSTLLRICAGLVRPSGGTVQRSRRVGFVPQDGGTAGWLTAGEHFTLFGAAAGLASRRARSTGEHLAARLAWRPAHDQLAQHLSGGTRQKLNLVLGELHAPDLLLLDEPYQGFDQGTYLDFWRQVHAWRDAGKAVVVVTHLLHDLQHVDHVYDLGAAA